MFGDMNIQAGISNGKLVIHVADVGSMAAMDFLDRFAEK